MTVQNDAFLVEAAGAERVFEVIDSEAAGGRRQQTWRFAGRAECQRCHNKWSGPPLAFNTPQLNRAYEHGESLVPQIDLFAQIGLLEKPIDRENRPVLSNPKDPSASLDQRARAYLQVNCAHCHRMHAGGSVLSLMHYDVPLDKTNMVVPAHRKGRSASTPLKSSLPAIHLAPCCSIAWRNSAVAGCRMSDHWRWTGKVWN